MASPPADRHYDLMTVIRRSEEAADKMNNMGISLTMLVFGLVAAISRFHVRISVGFTTAGKKRVNFAVQVKESIILDCTSWLSM